MNCYVKEISTSLNAFNNIAIIVKAHNLHLYFPKSCPPKMIWIENEMGVKLLEEVTHNNQIELSCYTLKDGFYYIHVFIDFQKSEYYEGYIYGKEIVLRKKNGEIYVKLCPYYFWNKKLLKNIDTLYSYNIPLVDSNIEVTKLAQLITKQAKNVYEQMFLIHEWVADNLFYDYDSLKSKNRTNLSVYEVLESGKCVCQGYADLSLALLNSLGIKAEGILCRALCDSKQNGWSDITNRMADLNHVITRAYTGTRWVIMDVTWDSSNRYENGVWIKSNRKTPSHKYFDISLQLLSSTHKLFKR